MSCTLCCSLFASSDGFDALFALLQVIYKRFRASLSTPLHPLKRSEFDRIQQSRLSSNLSPLTLPFAFFIRRCNHLIHRSQLHTRSRRRRRRKKSKELSEFDNPFSRELSFLSLLLLTQSPMSISPLGDCVVCGQRTAKRCSSCASHGTDWMYFCSQEHQKS